MLFGYEKKENDFREAALSGALGHAYLFFGDSGIGKRTFAHSFANFLENGSFGVPEAPLLDARIFSPDEKNVFSVDKAREIKTFLFQRPFRSPRRTVIVDDSETLTEEAQASLLKVVEEPPPSGLVIFVASREEIFFRPLLSRLTRIYFPRMSSAELVRVLRSEYGVETARGEKVAKDSFGSVGRALSSLFPPEEEEKKGDDFGESLEREILSLRRKGILKNAPLIAELLRKKALWERYNLNAPLQKKSVSYIIQKHERTF